jgi:hypothetical protein
MANYKRKRRVQRQVLDAIARCAETVAEYPHGDPAIAASQAARDLASVLLNLSWVKED